MRKNIGDSLGDFECGDSHNNSEINAGFLGGIKERFHPFSVYCRLEDSFRVLRKTEEFLRVPKKYRIFTKERNKKIGREFGKWYDRNFGHYFNGGTKHFQNY